MRERAAVCRGATLRESIAGTHLTWDNDGFCSPCRVLNAQTIARLAAGDSHRRASGAGTSAVPAPSSPTGPLLERSDSAGGSHRPTRASTPSSVVTVLEPCTASRGGDTFDGHLQVPSGGPVREDSSASLTSVSPAHHPS